MGNVLITADSTCDLGETFREHYQLRYFPYHIILDNKEYSDGVDITPIPISRLSGKENSSQNCCYRNRRIYRLFPAFVEQGFEIVHFCLGSSLSSTYQNCCIAAEDLGHVYPVDSRSLSTGMGLQVIEAAEMARTGLSAQEFNRKPENSLTAVMPLSSWIRLSLCMPEGAALQ